MMIAIYGNVKVDSKKMDGLFDFGGRDASVASGRRPPSPWWRAALRL